MSARPSNSGFYRKYGKRILEWPLTLLALVVLSPLILLVSLLLWFSVGPPVVFRQRRPGYKGNPFTLHKFRTMRETRDPNDALLPDEERITRIGMFLRRFSLDELPELVNVLKGEMSLVGPRPLLMQYLERYTSEQARRHEVLPGITGWAQVNGRNALTWERKFSLDVWYVDHLSLKLDLHILGLTLWKVLRREGIGYEDAVSAPEFMGTPDD